MSNSFNDTISDLKQKFDALNQRERLMIGAAVLCILYGLYSVTLEPVFTHQQKIQAELKTNQSEQRNLMMQIDIMQTPNVKKSAEQIQIDLLEHQLTDLNAQVSALQDNLVDPAKMPDLLSDLLNQNQNLTLVSLRTLPPPLVYVTTILKPYKTTVALMILLSISMGLK